MIPLATSYSFFSHYYKAPMMFTKLVVYFSCVDRLSNFTLCSCVKHAFVHECGVFAIKQSNRSPYYVEAIMLGMTASIVGTWKVFKQVLYPSVE